MKFKAGDVLVRTAYKSMKTAKGRGECTVVAVLSDDHPIRPRMWYVTIDADGRERPGLCSVVDGCFELKN